MPKPTIFKGYTLFHGGLPFTEEDAGGFDTCKCGNQIEWKDGAFSGKCHNCEEAYTKSDYKFQNPRAIPFIINEDE